MQPVAMDAMDDEFSPDGNSNSNLWKTQGFIMFYPPTSHLTSFWGMMTITAGLFGKSLKNGEGRPQIRPGDEGDAESG